MPERGVARTLQTMTDVLFAACFGAVLLRLLLCGAEYISGMPAEPNNVPALCVAFLWLCVLLLAAYCMGRYKNTAVGRFFVSAPGIVLAFASLLAAQLVLALCCYCPSGWDPQVLISTANDMLVGTPYTGTYFHQNPNNLFLLGGYRYFFAMLNRFGITDYLPWAVAMGVCLVNLAVLFLFLLSRRLFGTRVAWLSFLLCAPAAALSPWIAVPYSDTYSMPFAMGSIYFYVLAREQRHPLRSGLYAALCGAWLALGARMKPTIVLLIVAVVLVELLCIAGRRRAFSVAAPSTENGQEHTAVFQDNAPFESFRNCDRSPRRAILCAGHKCNVKSHCDTGAQQAKSAAVQGHPLLRVAACFLLGLLLAYGAGGMFQNHATNGFLNDKRVEQESFSATHYLMMGLSQPHGSYAYEDMKFTESVKGREAKAEANLAETARRLHKLGPTGYAAFLWRKLNFTWDDGTFFFGREGMFYWGEPPQNSAFARAVQSVFRADGAHYGALALWQQAQWLLLLLLMLCGTLYRKGPYAKWIWCARIGTLGLLCFLLLFEARSRYIYHFLPVLYLAALGGLLVLLQACMRARSPAAHDAAAMQNSRKGDDLCQSLPQR